MSLEQGDNLMKKMPCLLKFPVCICCSSFASIGELD